MSDMISNDIDVNNLTEEELRKLILIEKLGNIQNIRARIACNNEEIDELKDEMLQGPNMTFSIDVEVVDIGDVEDVKEELQNLRDQIISERIISETKIAVLNAELHAKNLEIQTIRQELNNTKTQVNDLQDQLAYNDLASNAVKNNSKDQIQQQQSNCSAQMNEQQDSERIISETKIAVLNAELHAKNLEMQTIRQELNNTKTQVNDLQDQLAYNDLASNAVKNNSKDQIQQQQSNCSAQMNEQQDSERIISETKIAVLNAELHAKNLEMQTIRQELNNTKTQVNDLQEQLTSNAGKNCTKKNKIIVWTLLQLQCT